MKWLVDEMTGRQNDCLKKWMQMASWWDDRYMKWLDDGMTSIWNDRLMKRQVDKMTGKWNDW